MNWLLKLLGYHVCEDFTPWVRREIKPSEEHFPGLRVVNMGRTFYWRWCNECGKLQRGRAKDYLEQLLSDDPAETAGDSGSAEEP